MALQTGNIYGIFVKDCLAPGDDFNPMASSIVQYIKFGYCMANINVSGPALLYCDPSADGDVQDVDIVAIRATMDIRWNTAKRARVDHYNEFQARMEAEGCKQQ